VAEKRSCPGHLSIHFVNCNIEERACVRAIAVAVALLNARIVAAGLEHDGDDRLSPPLADDPARTDLRIVEGVDAKPAA
jgi:hypothetical protein